MQHYADSLPFLTIIAMAMAEGDPLPLTTSTLDPQWIDDRKTSKLQRRNGNGNGNGGWNGDNRRHVTFGELLTRWGHLSVTVSILLWMWGQYEGFQSWKREAEKIMTVNTERILELRESNKLQDQAWSAAYLEMYRRLEEQRIDIKDVQRQINSHAQTEPPQRYRNSGSVR